MITAVFTQWGWVSAKAMYRFKEAHATAVEKGQTLFTLDNHGWDTRFVGYLIQHCENERLVPEKPAEGEIVPLFQQDQGSA